jgi:hypothetical protein
LALGLLEGKVEALPALRIASLGKPEKRATRVGRPWGSPPPVISSKPLIPVAAFISSSLNPCSISSILYIPFKTIIIRRSISSLLSFPPLKESRDLICKMLLGNGAGNAVCFPGALEKDQGRRALDSIPGHQCGMLVGIHLDEFDSAGEFPGRLFEGRRKAAAVSATGGPELNDHGTREIEDFPLESSGCNIDRMLRKMES